MTNKPRGRGPVVYLNREKKAKMIEAIVSDCLGTPVTELKILDIGCGNGDISQYFSKNNTVWGVDVDDRRKPENNGFTYATVVSEELPYDDAYFDVVLSHHVIEHVKDQELHLQEMKRVVKPDGVVYVATPNKSSPIMEGHVGNDQVLRFREMRPLYEANGYRAQEYSTRIVKEPVKFLGEVVRLSWIPVSILKLLRPLFPSHVYTLTVARKCAGDHNWQRRVW